MNGEGREVDLAIPVREKVPIFLEFACLCSAYRDRRLPRPFGENLEKGLLAHCEGWAEARPTWTASTATAAGVTPGIRSA